VEEPSETGGISPDLPQVQVIRYVPIYSIMQLVNACRLKVSSIHRKTALKLLKNSNFLVDQCFNIESLHVYLSRGSQAVAAQLINATVQFYKVCSIACRYCQH